MRSGSRWVFLGNRPISDLGPSLDAAAVAACSVGSTAVAGMVVDAGRLRRVRKW